MPYTEATYVDDLNGLWKITQEGELNNAAYTLMGPVDPTQTPLPFDWSRRTIIAATTDNFLRKHAFFTCSQFAFNQFVVGSELLSVFGDIYQIVSALTEERTIQSEYRPFDYFDDNGALWEIGGNLFTDFPGLGDLSVSGAPRHPAFPVYSRPRQVVVRNLEHPELGLIAVPVSALSSVYAMEPGTVFGAGGFTFQLIETLGERRRSQLNDATATTA